MPRKKDVAMVECVSICSILLGSRRQNVRQRMRKVAKVECRRPPKAIVVGSGGATAKEEDE